MANPAEQIIELESMARTSVDQIDRLTSEIKKLTEMMQSAMTNDGAYKEASDKVKELTKLRQRAKMDLLKNQATKSIYDKLKDLKQEKKELIAGQSEYLSEYKRMTGQNQLELFDGSVMEIIEVCKLIKPFKK